jgi:hypothetical protein
VWTIAVRWSGTHLCVLNSDLYTATVSQTDTEPQKEPQTVRNRVSNTRMQQAYRNEPVGQDVCLRGWVVHKRSTCCLTTDSTAKHWRGPKPRPRKTMLIGQTCRRPTHLSHLHELTTQTDSLEMKGEQPTHCTESRSDVCPN